MTEKEILQAALRYSDINARSAFLDGVCAGDSALRARIDGGISANSSSYDATNQSAQISALSADLNTTLQVDVESSNSNAFANVRLEAATTIEGKFGKNLLKSELHFLLPSREPDSLGRLGNYEILQIIGRGAFGVVLKAFDEKLHRVVAIKILSSVRCTSDLARQQFLREARMSASVRSEHVVHIYAVNEDPIPHIVMEYIPGQTVQQRIDQSGPMNILSVLELGQQIALGLAAAHALGLIHRDIKPANLLIEPEPRERLKITDFGLARTVDNSSVSQDGVISGTPMYMSPEQAQGAHLDPRADLFSLGSVLYVMLTGRQPFPASSAIGVLRNVVESTPSPIQEIAPDIPDWLCQIVSKLHAKTPDQRFSSAAEVAGILGTWITGFQRGQIPLIPTIVSQSPTTLDVTDNIQKVEPPPIKLPVAEDSGVKTNPLKLKATQVPFAKLSSWLVSAALIVVTVPVMLIFIVNWNERRASTQHTAVRHVDHAPVAPVHAAPATSVIIDAPANLLSRLNPGCMADGRFADISIRDDIITLDARNQSPNMWINFFDIAGEEMTIQTQVRIVTPEGGGFTKLIFKPYSQTEYFALVGNIAGKQQVWIDSGDGRRKNDEGAPVPKVLTGEWIDLQFTVSKSKYTVLVDNELVIQAARDKPISGFAAIGVGGWKCELKGPQVIVHK